MSEKAWAYYSSAADDEITMRENHAAYHRYDLRCDRDGSWKARSSGRRTQSDKSRSQTRCDSNGRTSLECCECFSDSAKQIPTLASCSFDEIIDGAQPGQTWYRYVNKDREITKKIVQHAEERGIKGLFITVDAPQLGRREKDALEAYDQGLAGVVLSNHGGRQIDFSRSGVEVLAEVTKHLGEERGLKFPNEKFQLFVDGGVRRATDVLKASHWVPLPVSRPSLPVGVGRPFLYAFSSYGVDGVDKALQILHDEFEMNLRLLGAPTLKDVVPSMVDASSLSNHLVAVPDDRLYMTNYETLQTARLKGPSRNCRFRRDVSPLHRLSFLVDGRSWQ
ncbi:FMN-dependent dehydrogenase-domain-containing protein [Salix suchowensis]|nr:FMN-dependent dehydrogenase-domain-containing protein [Salix suchowensis]